MSVKPRIRATRVFLKFLEDDMNGLRDGVRVHRSHIGLNRNGPTFDSEEYVVVENLVNGLKVVCQVIGQSNSYDRSHKDKHGTAFNRNTIVLSYRLMRKLGIRGERDKVEIVVRQMSIKDKLTYFLKPENPKERWMNWVGLFALVVAITEIRHVPAEAYQLILRFLAWLF